MISLILARFLTKCSRHFNLFHNPFPHVYTQEKQATEFTSPMPSYLRTLG